MFEPFAVHALTNIEAEDDIQWDLIELDEIDVLQHAFVFHFEVFPAKPRDRLAAIGDEHVHTNGFDP